ncbi:MAG: efflux RND transporter permease subunit [Phycisphaerales bacterium]|nr:efflux RND transporter permease subunit [Phycisphaerales bacterium]
MLKKLVQFSLNQSALVLLIAGVLLVFAGWQLPRIPVDVFPELNAPTVVVMGESPGLAADEVEQYVTFPIETAMNGLPGVRRVRTASAIGLSITYVEFDWGTDIYRARQLVSERMDAAREGLPVEHLEMTPITSITGEIMLLALSSPDGSVSDLDLRAYAEFDLRNKLLAVPGVAQVIAIGGELPEFQINVRQEELRLYGLTVQDVVDAARESHSTLSAGYLSDAEGMELPLRQTGQVQAVSDIAGAVIKYHKGAPVTIGQIADVSLSPSPKRGTGADGGRPAVVLTLQKAPGTNTLTITAAVDEALDKIAMPAGIVLNRAIFRQADFIDRSVSNITHALRDAAIIVAVLLILFLQNVRTTLITLTALPLSLAVGLLVLHWMGMTVNAMTLGGFAIAIGSLVDDAIIAVENVFRRLRQAKAHPEADLRSTTRIIFDATLEIMNPMVFATIIIVLVFLPLMFLEGIEGRFFRPLGIAFVVSIMASLLVAITVTPALCMLLMKHTGEHHERDGLLVRWLKRGYEPTVRAAVRWRSAVLGAAALVTVLSLWLASTFGTSFLPEFNEGTFTIALMAPPGTSLAASNRMAGSVEQQLLQIEGVRSVTRRTGRAERDEHAEPVSNSEVDVTIKPGYDKEEVRNEIARVLSQVPGITTNIGQPIEHRLSHILSGTPAAVAISVYGDDLAKLRVIAKEIETAIKPLPGARDVAANREVLITSLPVRYRPHDLAAYGLSPASAAQQVRTAVFGEHVATVNQGVRRYDIVVRLASDQRDQIDDIRDLTLRGKGGAIVRLSEVADIGREQTSNLIARENAQRKAVISLNVAEGYNLGHLVEEVQQRVDPIVAKHGYTVHYGGQFEAQRSASRTILIFSGVVLVVMLMLLNLAIGSLKVSLLVMVNLPLALIGGIAAIFLTESTSVFANALALIGIGGRYQAPVISIASMVGFITLFGIAVRNGILLVNHYRNLVERESCTVEQAIVRGSMERLVPILMTALAAALGLVPIVFRGNEPGNEILAPLSVVILGGLLTSTFLNLVVVPAGYALLFRHQLNVVPSALKNDRIPISETTLVPQGEFS